MTAALATVLEHTERRRDAVRAALLQAEAHARQLQAQAEQLLSYRDEYRRGDPARAGRSAGIELLHVQRAFMERLQQALDQQQAQAEAAAARLAPLREELLALELRAASVRKLLERRADAKRLDTDRREQRAADDAATQRLLRLPSTALPAAL